MKANYIIFHPEKQRVIASVKAIALVNGSIINNWSGNVFVDKIGNGNEDPYVFCNPWLYSYCHATQLRKNYNKFGNYIQKGSWILFASGQMADKDILTFDTVFLVDYINQWIRKPYIDLPLKFQSLKSNQHDPLWLRHFQFPFQGQHASVIYTYESALWQSGDLDYSFLPYNNIGDRVSIPISALPADIRVKISSKIKGKYPVLLDDYEVKIILQLIIKNTSIQVLRDIR